MRGFWHGVRWLLSPFDYFRAQGAGTWRARLPGLGEVLITGDPALLAEVMGHPELVGGKAHKALRATLGEDHLIVSWGAPHRERRRVVQQALQAFPRDELIEEVTRVEVSRYPAGSAFSLHEAGHRASLRIMLQGLLGPMSLAEEAPLLSAAEAFQGAFSNPLVLFLPWLRRDLGAWSPWGRLLRRRAELVRLLVAAVPKGDCMAARLRPHLDASGYANELLALLMFGHETTAASLSWCLAHAFERPSRAARIRDGDEVYALAFVQECLRVSPPVAQLTRVATAPLNLSGWRVEEGGVVMPAIPLAHLSLGEEFWPERFLGPPPAPTSYCPFGFGNRLCPGRAVALRQLTVMLMTLLRDFRWRLVDVSTRPRRHLFLVLPQGGVRVCRENGRGVTEVSRRDCRNADG